MSRVLLVEDERTILTALAITLRAAGYAVDCATSAAHALATAVASPPDVVVLDLGLPDLDGVEVIHGLRGWTDVPIIVLSGRTDSTDKVEALDAGADDYVTKPFDTQELLARLRVARRRRGEGSQSEQRVRVSIGDHEVDLPARTVRGPGEVTLTPTEWAVLEVLVRHPGRLVSRRELLARVWGQRHGSDSDSLRTYLARLRRKLERDPTRPRHLLTEPGMGYRFRP